MCYPGFPHSPVSKESACNAGDLSLIPGLGRSPGEGDGNLLSILAWKIPWTEQPGRLQSKGVARVGHDLVTKPPPICYPEQGYLYFDRIDSCDGN